MIKGFALTALATLALVTSHCSLAKSSYVYISNAGSGSISAFQLDTSSGKLTALGDYAAGKQVMPMVASKDNQTLYAAIRSQPYRIKSFHIDKQGKLTPSNETAVVDQLAYITLDKTGRYLLGSSYGGDLFTVLQVLKDGSLNPQPVQTVATGKRAHSIQTDPTNQFVYVPLLGADQLAQYRFDEKSGKTMPLTPSFVNVQHDNGIGPRHFVFAPHKSQDGQQSLYLLSEMQGTVERYHVTPNGQLSSQQVVEALPNTVLQSMQKGQAMPLTPGEKLAPSNKPRIWQADIHITPNGQFLYTTERSSSRLTGFSVSPQNGNLTLIDSIETEKQPRGFAIDHSGQFLIETGEKSDHFAVYRINQTTGKLSLLARYPAQDGANWVTIIDK